MTDKEQSILNNAIQVTLSKVNDYLKQFDLSLELKVWKDEGKTNYMNIGIYGIVKKYEFNDNKIIMEIDGDFPFTGYQKLLDRYNGSEYLNHFIEKNPLEKFVELNVLSDVAIELVPILFSDFRLYFESPDNQEFISEEDKKLFESVKKDIEAKLEDPKTFCKSINEFVFESIEKGLADTGQITKLMKFAFYGKMNRSRIFEPANRVQSMLDCCMELTAVNANNYLNKFGIQFELQYVDKDEESNGNIVTTIESTPIKIAMNVDADLLIEYCQNKLNETPSLKISVDDIINRWLAIFTYEELTYILFERTNSFFENEDNKNIISSDDKELYNKVKANLDSYKGQEKDSGFIANDFIDDIFYSHSKERINKYSRYGGWPTPNEPIDHLLCLALKPKE